MPPQRPAATRPGQPAASPLVPILNYDQHYRTHDTTPAQLMVDLQWLRREKRFLDVEQAIQAYLKYHGKKAESWMYLLLAVAFEVNGRGEASVKSALGWAGYLARRQGDPFTLIEVADVLLIRGYHAIPLPNGLPAVGPGELLDMAAEKAPQRPEPILLSLLLAEKTLDADRMADTMDRLLSLGWPGLDETWRREGRRRVEEMAKRLREEGRSEPAHDLLDRLDRAEARDLFLRLTWSGDAGLDLAVEEPLGAKAEPLRPRTVFGGAIVKSGRGKHPESVYTCPLGFDGDYQVRIETLYDNPKDPARNVTLEIVTHEGTPQEHRETKELTLPLKEPVTVHLQGGRRKKVLPYTAPARIVLVPEGQETPTAKPAPNAESPDVQPPTAADAAQLLRQGVSPAGRSSGATIRPDKPRSKSTTKGGKP